MELRTPLPTEDLLFSRYESGLFVEEAIRHGIYTMQTRHFHDSIEINFLLRGDRFYFIEQDTYHVGEGMAVLIGRNLLHKASTPDSGNPYHHRFLLQYDFEPYDDLLRRLGFVGLDAFGERYSTAVSFSPEDWQHIAASASLIKACITENSASSRARMTLAAADLLILFAQNADRERARDLTQGRALPTSSEKESYLVRTGVYQKVHEIALYLQKTCGEEHSLDEIAARFYVSRSNLTRMFKSVTGFTVTEYLAFARIKKARALLLDTRLTITEIAEQTGFGNVTYFERTFKRMAAMTPLQYRKNGGK
ncbi:MAG: AraC family transcriptional regulator [Eubacteriales bacterium]|nr:AraC family transcriptional regulator [Eubacteriales bacterium]